jgi:hypothetical protein
MATWTIVQPFSMYRRAAIKSSFSPATRQGPAACGGGCVPASGSENLEITDFFTVVPLTENSEHRPDFAATQS